MKDKDVDEAIEKLMDFLTDVCEKIDVCTDIKRLTGHCCKCEYHPMNVYFKNETARTDKLIDAFEVRKRREK